ncbi:aminotransferase class IV [Campylobacter pinnipediorum]|uniref:aminotransferase class IV n=1 Tax=Campylobacter pinnipediorum TaxID=1965231 RepID=UPI00084D82B2|nr:aminotransferase class IV [Campylobacter pinnipediorum]
MNSSKKSIFLFETIKLVDHKPQNLKYHISRAKNSIDKTLEFDFEDILEKTSSEAPLGIVRAKIIYNLEGEFIRSEFYPYKARNFRNFYIVSANVDYSRKFLNRSLIDKAKCNYEEIIIVKDGFVTDTSIANIAIFDNGWITPKTPLLKGTCRARLIENGFLRQEDISINRLMNTKRFAIMNALIDFYEIEDFEIIKTI